MFISKLHRAITLVEIWLAGLSLVLLVLITVLQTIARNGFNIGFNDLEILSRHLVLFIMFLGAALVTDDGRHIKIDILEHLLSPASARLLSISLALVTALICFFLAWYGGRFWLEEWQYREAGQTWVVYLAGIIPLGFFLIGLQFLLNVFSPGDNDLPAN